MNARYTGILIFFTILTFWHVNLHAQDVQRGLVFKQDLAELIIDSSNLIKVNNDETRTTVVALQPGNKPIILENKTVNFLSVAFWFKPQNIDIHSGTLFGLKDIFYFRYLSNRQLQFNLFRRADINTKAFVAEDIWQHAAFTLNKNGKLRIYFNGSLVKEDTVPADWFKPNKKFIIGNDKYNVAGEGLMDDLQIWKRVLNPEEIQLVYNSSILFPPLDYRLQSYLPLEENAKDISINHAETEKVNEIEFITGADNKKSAHFISSGSYIKLNGLTFDKQKTIALWIKPTGNLRLVALVGNNDFTLRFQTKSKRLWFSVPMMYGIKTKWRNVDL